jgi:hypothetical protein
MSPYSQRLLGFVFADVLPDEASVPAETRLQPSSRTLGSVRSIRVILVVSVALAACGPQAGEPGDLVGMWRSDIPTATLELGVHSFRFVSGHLTKWGTVERTPFRVAFVLERTSSPAFNLYCRDTVDVYDWRLDDGELTFHAVGRPCDRAARAVLVAGRWRKAPG